MLKSFFKSAGRNMLKNKVYALINFIGLTCGIALSLLIITYVRYEMSYDQFHEKADRLYRIKYLAPNGMELAASPPPISPAMIDYFPEVEKAGRLYRRSVSIRRPNQQEAFEETNVYFADSAIMDMMPFKFIRGSKRNALHEKFTVIINQTMATKYFDNENPVGESLIFGGNHNYRVIGVVEDHPDNSHWEYNMLVPYDNMYDMENPQTAEIVRNNLAVNFIISHSYNYVLLRPGTNPEEVNAKMDDFVTKYAREDMQVGQKFSLTLVKDIHLKSTQRIEPTPTNSMSNIYIFLGVGLLTVIIACINYINLSTAQSFTRIKEIGLRKIMGSTRYHIILQFLAESFLFCLVAFGLSFLVFKLALPMMNELTGNALLFNEIVDAELISMAIGLLLLITILSGAYPAYFVTKFDSVNALKKEGASGYGNQTLRKALVVFQLAIACLLLSGSLLIMKQLRFLSNQPLGFEKEHIITVPLFSQNLNGIFSQRDSLFHTRLQTFRNGIESQAGVSHTALSSNVPGLGVVFRGVIPEGFTTDDHLYAAIFSVDYDFKDTYELELVAGRFFDESYATDVAEGFMVNEKAVNEYNWNSPEEAIGKTINREGKIGKVIGVVKDFNFATATNPMAPMVLEVGPNQFNVLTIRFENDNVKSTLDELESEWNTLFPEKSFEFSFLDNDLDERYSNFQDFAKIIQIFTFIAILISCLGVYGLVMFVVQRKVKEIGVRKVMGASILNILSIIYKDFSVLIVIGFVLAIPAAVYLMNQWLENFVYRVEVDALTFVFSFLLVVLITTLTISYQALKASMANPVVSLRSE